MKFAGIGPRTTPAGVLESMTEIARNLSYLGHTLSSGHGKGADQAWENGVSPLMQTVWLPWDGFNGANKQPRFKTVQMSQPLLAVAAKHHPFWNNLSDGVRKLLATNVAILFTDNLNEPVDYVLYWQDANVNKYAGGTGHTLRMADNYNIPNFNIGNTIEQQAFEQFLQDKS